MFMFIFFSLFAAVKKPVSMPVITCVRWWVLACDDTKCPYVCKIWILSKQCWL